MGVVRRHVPAVDETRRRLLTGTGLVALTALAGCVGVGEETDAPVTDEPGGAVDDWRYEPTGRGNASEGGGGSGAGARTPASASTGLAVGGARRVSTGGPTGN